MNRLFLWISGSMIIGILSSYYSHLNIFLIFFLLFIISLYSFYNIKREKLNNIEIIIIFLFLGMLLEMFFSKSTLIGYIDNIKDYSGIVKEISEDASNNKKYIVLIDKVDEKKISEEKTLLTIYGKQNLEIGWRVT